MSERKPGWYWVKAGNAPWAPSELSMSGHPCIVARGKTYEIGPRIPTPDEPWQMVPKEATRDMVRAAMERGAAFGAGAHYSAMLAAAPKPEDE